MKSCFINALIDEQLGSLRVEDARITEVGCAPRRGELVIDLEGDRIYPGLINAHDHLQLNHLPEVDSRRYRGVADWIADIDALRRFDPQFKALIAVAREERLLMGGLKNLLSGVTAVAHHDPLYAALSSDEFPVHVLRRYGWSHSLHIDGARAVGQSYRDTPRFWPWMIHAAEGLDAEATRDFEMLEQLGCIQANTLLIHGVGMNAAQQQALEQAGAGLIWCPASNTRLFGRTANVSRMLALGRVALGSDSRLSGARDLLDELRIAKDCAGLGEAALQALVTDNSAQLLRLAGRGKLTAGAVADLLILPARAGLGCARRADVRLVVKGGIVRFGDLDFAHLQEPAAPCVQVVVDGNPKMLDARIALRASQTRLQEPGLQFTRATWKAA
jgi:cytosine/adenosine deaminase-related metal-dependent hydrolase